MEKTGIDKVEEKALYMQCQQQNKKHIAEFTKMLKKNYFKKRYLDL